MTTNHRTHHRIFSRIGLALILAVYFAIVVYSSHRLSPSADEQGNVRSGMTLMTRGAYVDPVRAWWTRLDLVHPISDIAPALLARAAGQSPDFRSTPAMKFGLLQTARWANHLAGALILVLVFLWSERLWGSLGGFISALFLACFPTFIAHCSIVSSDLYMALGSLVAAWVIWAQFISHPENLSKYDRKFWKSAIVAGLSIAFAMLCKLNNIIFIGVAGIAACWAAWQMRNAQCGTPNNNENSKSQISNSKSQISNSKSQISNLKSSSSSGISNLKSEISHALLRGFFISTIVGALALLIVEIIYEATHRGADPFIIRNHSIKLPIGQALALSLNLARKLSQIQPLVYFQGELSPPKPWFYAVSFFLKTPLPMLLLLPATLRAAFAHRENRRAAVYLFGLASALALIFATRGIFMGLRHMMPIFVLLALLAGGLGRIPEFITPKNRIAMGMTGAVLILMLAWAAVLEIRNTPWQLSYYNPMGRRRMVAVDSECDWGQGLIALAEWQKRHSPGRPIWLAYFGDNDPADFGVHYRGLVSPYSRARVDPDAANKHEPAELSGYVAISKTQLAGIYMSAAGKTPDYYAAWISQKPLEVLAGSIVIFNGAKK